MADEKITQLRYTDQQVDQIKALFPNAESLKLYRKYLLDLPLKDHEIAQIKATFALPSMRAALTHATVPFINGDEPIGVGYDILNNIDINERDAAYLERRTQLFIKATEYLIDRLGGLGDLKKSAKGKGKWLSACVGDKSFDGKTLLQQLVIKQNVEGLLMGINALISAPVETAEERERRLKADSTN